MPVALISQPPTSAPAGIADHASTPAIESTRESKWLGTIACRRLPVLMLNRIPSPPAAAHNGSAAQNQRIPAKTTVQPPISISDVIASAVKLKRLRSLPASSPVTTTPALPAAKSRPICRSLASQPLVGEEHELGERRRRRRS